MGRMLLIFILFINSCSYPELVRDDIIYENDFENIDLTNINGGAVSSFNNSNVLGDFNNDSFTLHLDDIGDHEYIFVSFELYIHGSWDGNFNGFQINDKPDIWGLILNPDMPILNDYSNASFLTTFSNSTCFDNYCLRQSYPEEYPFVNNPKTGHHKTNLLEICKDSFFSEKTTLYKIEKVFKSSGNAVVLKFFDELYQPNAIDKDGNFVGKCDESWSIDNLTIRALNYR